MDSGLKRRDTMQQQQQPASTTQRHSDEENNISSGDKLISPCKRLRLHDSPAKSAVTFYDQTNIQAAPAVDISEATEQEKLYNTPEKTRHDINFPVDSVKQASIDISDTVEREKLFNTPEKTRLDAGFPEDSINPASNSLEKSDVPTDLTEEDPSVLSSIHPDFIQQNPLLLNSPQEHLNVSPDHLHDNNIRCSFVATQEEMLLSTPVKTLSFEEDGDDDDHDDEDDSRTFPTPLHTMPNNTPAKAVVSEEEENSEAEEIFINRTVDEDEPCAFNPLSGISITFADHTNLGGVCQEVDTLQDIEGHTSQRSVTFADQTNVHGAQKIADAPQHLPRHRVHKSRSKHKTHEKWSTLNTEEHRPKRSTDDGRSKHSARENNVKQTTRMEYDVQRCRLLGHPNPHPGSELGRPLPFHDFVGQPTHQQRPRFNSVGNLLSAEELDHHKLSLQSYGSLTHFEQIERQQPVMAGVRNFPGHQDRGSHPHSVYDSRQQLVTRSASHRKVFQPQNLQTRFDQAQLMMSENQERLVDYGSIDGPVGRGMGHPSDLNQGEVVDYGSMDIPGAGPPRLGGSAQNRENAFSASDTQCQPRLWYYGSIDNPQRLVSSMSSLNPGHQGPHPYPDRNSQSQGNLLRNDQPIVRSASRRTLPRLGSKSSEGHSKQTHHHGVHEKADRLGHSSAPSSRPHLDQVREETETSTISTQEDGKAGTSRNSQGSLCVLSSPSQGENFGHYPQGYNPQGYNSGHAPCQHPNLQLQHMGSTRCSGSAGSHAELISQGSSGRPDSQRHSEHSGDHYPHFSGSQGSLKSQAKSAGSQRSMDSQKSGGSQRTAESQEHSGENRGHWAETLPPPGQGCIANPALVEGSKKRRVLENPGQVKVSAYLNCGLVTVHVMEGRYFTCSWKALCDSYIKLSLIPEESGRKLRLKSRPVQDTNNPVFDEKFSLELQESDKNKRLLISIWHKDLVQSGCSEFLGCLSFGIRSILRNKDVNGWYYLLTEEVGKKKHLKVSPSQRVKEPVVRPRNSHGIPTINRDVSGLETVTLRIERGKNPGFGFTIIDDFPARVGRVDLASPADVAGLQSGDFIIKVNNQNVSRSTVNSVAKLVKKSGQFLLLQVNRQHCLTSEPKEPEMEPATAYDNPEKSFWRKPDHIYESIVSGNYPENSEIVVGHDEKENETVMDSCLEVSSVNEASTTDRMATSSTPLVTLGAKRGQSAPGKFLMTGEQKRLEAIYRLMNLEIDFIDFMQLGIQRYSRPLRHRIFNVVQHNTVFQNIEKLVDISSYHVKQMQENAPSIYSESDDDSQSSDDRHFASAVAMIYYSKVHMFCQAHERYAEGLNEANRVLSDMRQNEEFQRFVKDPPLEPGQPSISAFIFRPLQHIKELSSVFQEIFLHTTKNIIDHATLKEVTQVLQESVRSISNMSNARVQSLTSLSCHTKSSGSSKGSCAASSAASSKDSGSECGRGQRNMDIMKTSASLQTVRIMDREVMKMQDRLVFSENVPVFQLCHEDRHIIYQGDIFFLLDNNWSKIQMTLLSDIVMLCRPEKDGSLYVLWDPIYLQDICSIDTSKKHTTEMVLNTCSASQYTGETSAHKLLFRTPSPEDMSTWKNLLEHRVKKAQEDSSQDSCVLDAPSKSPTTE